MRAAVVLLLLGACADADLARRVAELETRIEALERRPVAAAPVATPSPRYAFGPAHRASPEARALYEQAKEAMARGDHAEARRLLEEMTKVPIQR